MKGVSAMLTRTVEVLNFCNVPVSEVVRNNEGKVTSFLYGDWKAFLVPDGIKFKSVVNGAQEKCLDPYSAARFILYHVLNQPMKDVEDQLRQAIHHEMGFEYYEHPKEGLCLRRLNENLQNLS
jgi:hypothetical protein